jgi:hypothetical protein
VGGGRGEGGGGGREEGGEGGGWKGGKGTLNRSDSLIWPHSKDSSG